LTSHGHGPLSNQKIAGLVQHQHHLALSDFTATKRIVDLATASQIAVLPNLT